MRFYIIAGEKSGDLHASNLVNALKKEYPTATFRGFGGDLMENNGVELAKHYRETAFMGFFEVVQNLGTIRKLISFCKKDILEFKPDAVIFVDYPGFNLRIAKYLRNFYTKNSSIKTPKLFYYISPKLWAWNQSRAKQIKRNIDYMFSILPFEIEFYKQFNFDRITYVGNPLFDSIDNFNPNNQFLIENNLKVKDDELDDNSNQKIIALLAGSRKQEVKSLLPVMIEVVNKFKAKTDSINYKFVLAGVSSLDESLYDEAKANGIDVIFEQTYDLLSHADAAIVASGTATLETALFQIPQVVIYKVNAITYQIAKLVIKVKWVSLVNLIANKEIVKELLQHDANVSTISQELELLLDTKSERYNFMTKEYSKLKNQIQTEGVSIRTAQKIKEILG
ncbi:lipid-A-disaccharide synthase [Bernardetia litoralis DSM 6794]|uniref:Lipid-A-disaccharide synthase n=1 Tax=Bernardetia litoralis (strain ATCC 23117 / DSM 6794 / NBRC 15988 / NCIMB 1366 / Fx l1 / Sio-4) TaxID=880071 RepID=I4APD6_BERLS|nr:lipid-A-disaccharide synthase [Bernardetia litoralis]AFM05821.1 lipid-A-disaccharide synthase [Bernardetia litoralis DSM 6794]